MALLGAVPSVAAPRDIRVAAGTPSEIRLLVNVPELLREPAVGAPGRVVLTLDGYFTAGADGEPGIPERVVTVAVPPEGDVVVLATGAGEERFDSLAVAARRRADPEGGSALASEPASGVYGRALARLVDVSWLRNQRIARVAITPLRYDAGSGMATLQRTIELRLQVDAASAAAASSRSAARTTGAARMTGRAARPDPFESVYREAVVNYDQGLAWRRVPDPASSRAARGAKTAATRSGSDVQLVSDITLVGKRWVKVGVPATGLYRLRFGQFRRFAPFNDDTTTRLEDLRLLTLPGVPVLPETSFCDTCDFRQVAIGLIDNGDGRLNRSDDAIYFYGLGPSDWEDVYDASRPDTNFLNNPYETRNFYYLGIDNTGGSTPSRITTRSAAVDPDGTELTPTTFPARVHREVDARYLPDHPPPAGSTFVWDKWFWSVLAPLGTFIATIDAPGADTTQAASLRARFVGFAADVACAEVFRTQLMDFTWNGSAPQRMGWRGYVPWTARLTLPHAKPVGNRFTATSAVVRCNNDIAVSWVDLFYRRRFEPVANRLEFRSFDTGALLYRAGPFTGSPPPRVFDVTDPHQPVELLQLGWDVPTGTVSFEAQQAGPSRYVIGRDSSMTDVLAANITSASPMTLTDLKSATLGAEYVVIYYDEFQAAADTLAAWRHAHQGWNVFTVPVSALYDQFSGGRTDPASIRNFLRATDRFWNQTPGYVQFIGDASYDFKNLTGQAPAGKPPVLLPTWEGGYDAGVLRQFTTDDWLLNVDEARVIIPDFLTGRIPAADATAAMDVVRTKILFYERSAPLGDYRNRVMLVADDEEQGLGCDPLHWTHLAQTDDLARDHMPAHIDPDYIYLHAYAGDDTKPEAKDALFEDVNGIGVAVVNYVGHGSPFKLADESVLQTGDLSRFRNTEKLPVFFAASCDVGKFSDPINESLGELLVRRTGGGGVAVISSTELAFSDQNARLNAQIYDHLFDRGVDGKYHHTLSEALLVGKLGGVNNQKYQLMGDAATRLNLPELWLELTIDPEQVADTTADSLTLVQGGVYRFTGRVVDHPGGPPVPVDGVADMLVEDSAPTLLTAPCRDLPDCTTCAPQFYRYNAGAIFRGNVEVRSGELQGRFMVPVEARPGGEARIRAYLMGNVPRVDGAGAETLSVATGVPPAGDTQGPEIRLSFANGATTVAPGATLRVDLSDPSGILITGHTPQNGIVVTIDDNSTTRVDITDTFRYSANSYQTGSASYTLPTEIAEGPHKISVSAADNLAAGFAAALHRSVATIEFEVNDEPPLQILSAYLFPNPTSSRGGSVGGRFVVDTQGDALNVLLRIYTGSGKLIRTLSREDVRGQIQLPWDGLDAEGQALANGLYLFKVHVNPRGEDGSSEATQKADAEGRFVILNR